MAEFNTPRIDAKLFTTYLPWDTVLVYEDGIKTFEGSPTKFSYMTGVWMPDPLGDSPTVVEFRITYPSYIRTAEGWVRVR